MASMKKENAKKSIAWKKVSSLRAAPLERCRLQPSVGHINPDAWRNKLTEQAELKPRFVPGEGETGHAGGLRDAGDKGTSWATRKPQPCPPSLTLSIFSSASSAHLSPVHGVITGCCIPAVGKAQFIHRGE